MEQVNCTEEETGNIGNSKKEIVGAGNTFIIVNI